AGGGRNGVPVRRWIQSCPPRRRRRRLLRVIHRLVGLVAFVAAGIAVPVATASVHSASPANTPCLDNVGITIVVDFHELGGGVNIRCAPGPVTSGLDALDKAG